MIIKCFHADIYSGDGLKKKHLHDNNDDDDKTNER